MPDLSVLAAALTADPAVLALSLAHPKHVRTPEGAAKYNVPIGTLITRHMIALQQGGGSGASSGGGTGGDSGKTQAVAGKAKTPAAAGEHAAAAGGPGKPATPPGTPTGKKVGYAAKDGTIYQIPEGSQVYSPAAVATDGKSYLLAQHPDGNWYQYHPDTAGGLLLPKDTFDQVVPKLITEGKLNSIAHLGVIDAQGKTHVAGPPPAPGHPPEPSPEPPVKPAEGATPDAAKQEAAPVHQEKVGPPPGPAPDPAGHPDKHGNAVTVYVSGMHITPEQLDHAIATLEHANGVAISQPLNKVGNPLATADYKAYAKAFAPDLPANRISFLAYLKAVKGGQAGDLNVKATPKSKTKEYQAENKAKKKGAAGLAESLAPKVEHKPEPKPEHKAEPAKAAAPVAESKPKPAESKPEPKVEAKPEPVKAEPKVEVKPEPKAAPAKLAEALTPKTGKLPPLVGVTYEHKVSDSGKHRYVLAHYKGERIGDMTWKTDEDHRITFIGVYDEENRRRGVATGMWNKAHEIDPEVKHNFTEGGQTVAGKGWADATPKPKVEAKPAKLAEVLAPAAKKPSVLSVQQKIAAYHDSPGGKAEVANIAEKMGAPDAHYSSVTATNSSIFEEFSPGTRFALFNGFTATIITAEGEGKFTDHGAGITQHGRSLTQVLQTAGFHGPNGLTASLLPSFKEARSAAAVNEKAAPTAAGEHLAHAIAAWDDPAKLPPGAVFGTAVDKDAFMAANYDVPLGTVMAFKLRPDIIGPGDPTHELVTRTANGWASLGHDSFQYPPSGGGIWNQSDKSKFYFPKGLPAGFHAYTPEPAATAKVAEAAPQAPNLFDHAPDANLVTVPGDYQLGTHTAKLKAGDKVYRSYSHHYVAHTNGNVTSYPVANDGSVTTWDKSSPQTLAAIKQQLASGANVSPFSIADQGPAQQVKTASESSAAAQLAQALTPKTVEVNGHHFTVKPGDKVYKSGVNTGWVVHPDGSAENEYGEKWAPHSVIAKEVAENGASGDWKLVHGAAPAQEEPVAAKPKTVKVKGHDIPYAEGDHVYNGPLGTVYVQHPNGSIDQFVAGDKKATLPSGGSVAASLALSFKGNSNYSHVDTGGPAPLPSVTQSVQAGLVQVAGMQITPVQLQHAITTLENTHPGDVMIKQPLAKAGNPLWNTDYKLFAKTFDPNSKAKPAFLAYLKSVQASHQLTAAHTPLVPAAVMPEPAVAPVVKPELTASTVMINDHDYTPLPGDVAFKSASSGTIHVHHTDGSITQVYASGDTWDVAAEYNVVGTGKSITDHQKEMVASGDSNWSVVDLGNTPAPAAAPAVATPDDVNLNGHDYTPQPGDLVIKAPSGNVFVHHTNGTTTKIKGHSSNPTVTTEPTGVTKSGGHLLSVWHQSLVTDGVSGWSKIDLPGVTPAAAPGTVQINGHNYTPKAGDIASQGSYGVVYVQHADHTVTKIGTDGSMAVHDKAMYSVVGDMLQAGDTTLYPMPTPGDPVSVHPGYPPGQYEVTNAGVLNKLTVFADGSSNFIGPYGGTHSYGVADTKQMLAPGFYSAGKTWQPAGDIPVVQPVPTAVGHLVPNEVGQSEPVAHEPGADLPLIPKADSLPAGVYYGGVGNNSYGSSPLIGSTVAAQTGGTLTVNADGTASQTSKYGTTSNATEGAILGSLNNGSLVDAHNTSVALGPKTKAVWVTGVKVDLSTANQVYLENQGASDEALYEAVKGWGSHEWETVQQLLPPGTTFEQQLRRFIGNPTATQITAYKALNKAKTAVPEAHTGAPVPQLMNPASVAAHNITTANAAVKELAKQAGFEGKVGKLVNASLEVKQAWLKAFYAGHFDVAYQIEANNFLAQGKPVPTLLGKQHPGSPTYPGGGGKVHFLPKDPGQTAAGTPAAASPYLPADYKSASLAYNGTSYWTNYGSGERREAYLLATGLAGVSHGLSTSDVARMIVAHVKGDQAQVDQFTARAQVNIAAGYTPSPVVLPLKELTPQGQPVPLPAGFPVLDARQSHADHLDDNQLKEYLSNLFPKDTLATMLGGQSHQALAGLVQLHYLSTIGADPKSFHSPAEAKTLYEGFSAAIATAQAGYERDEEAKKGWGVLESLGTPNKVYTKAPAGQQISMDGAQEKYIALDQHGTRYMFKVAKSPHRAQVEDAAHHIGKLFGFSMAGSSLATVGSDYGQVQTMVDKVGTLEGRDLTKLSPIELADVLTIHVLNRAIDDDDSHTGNYFVTPNGHVVPIDKGRAYARFGTYSLGYGQKSNSIFGTMVYDTVYQAISNGKYDQAAVDGAYKAAIKRAKFIQTRSDDTYRALLSSGLENRPAGSYGSRTTAANKVELIEQAVARKNGLEAEFQSWWAGIYKAAGFQLPEISKAVEPGVHSGFSAELGEDVIKGKAHGHAAFFSGNTFEEEHLAVQQVQTATGALRFRATGLIRKVGGADGKLTAFLKAAHLSNPGVIAPSQPPSANTSISALTPKASTVAAPTEEGLYQTVLKAAKTVNQHATDGQYNETHLGVMDFAIMQAQEALKAYQADPDTVGKGWFGDKPILAGKYAESLQHYIDAAGVLTAAKNAKVKAPSHMQRYDYTYTPELVPTVTPLAAPSLPYTVTKRKRSVEDATQDPTTRQLVLSGDHTPFPEEYSSLPLDEYQVDFADGSKLFYLPYSSSAPSSQEGLVRFQGVDGASVDTSFHSAMDLLGTAGLDLAESDESSHEQYYWRHMFAVLNGRQHNGGDIARAKKVKDKFAALKPDEAGISPEESLSRWRAVWSEFQGAKSVEDWVASRGYLPRFHRMEVTDHETGHGRPHWLRFDLDAAEFRKQAKDPLASTLTGSYNTSGVADKEATGVSVIRIAKGGSTLPTEERWRVFGTWKGGGSSTSDQQKGSGQFYFTRQHVKSSFPFQVYMDPALALQTSSYAYSHDNFGDKSDKQSEAYFSPVDALKHHAEDNETMVKQGVSVLDGVMFMVLYTEEQRSTIIDYYKSLGIIDVRGIALGDFFVTPTGRQAALTRSRKRLADGIA